MSRFTRGTHGIWDDTAGDWLLDCFDNPRDFSSEQDAAHYLAMLRDNAGLRVRRMEWYKERPVPAD